MVDLTKLKTQLERMSRTEGEVFDDAFYSAINSAIYDLMAYTDLDVSAVDDGETEIDLAAKYTNFFLQGAMFYMAKGYTWFKQSVEVNDADYRRALAIAQGSWMTDESPPSGMPDSSDD
jgi:hypothetical protein